MVFSLAGLLGEGIVVVAFGEVAESSRAETEAERWRVGLCECRRGIMQVPSAIPLLPFCDLCP